MAESSKKRRLQLWSRSLELSDPLILLRSWICRAPGQAHAVCVTWDTPAKWHHPAPGLEMGRSGPFPLTRPAGMRFHETSGTMHARNVTHQEHMHAHGSVVTLNARVKPF